MLPEPRSRSRRGGRDVAVHVDSAPAAWQAENRTSQIDNASALPQVQTDMGILKLRFLPAVGLLFVALTPGYRPPLDYTAFSYEQLTQKLGSADAKERESAAHFMWDRLRWNDMMRRDARRTYEDVKQAMVREPDRQVRSAGWSVIANILRFSPEGEKILNADQQFWLAVMTNSHDTIAVSRALYIAGSHHVGWARDAVVHALSFTNDDVQLEALYAVRELKITDAEPMVREILLHETKNGCLETMATITLRVIGTSASIPALVSARDRNHNKGHSVAEQDLAIRAIMERSQNVAPEKPK